MASILESYLAGQQGAMQQGQNALAMQQQIEKIKRQQAMQNILSQNLMPAQAAIPAMGAAEAQGPMMPGAAPLPNYPAQAAMAATPATFNRQGAFDQLLAGGYIPEAMAIEPKAKKDTGFTLGEGQKRFDASGKVIASTEPKKGGEKDLSSNLRKEFTNQAKDFVKVRDAYRRIEASAKDPSAAGDMALIFNYMKVLDPGSTVREGEFATAQNATGVGEQVINAYNRVLSGERLNPTQRNDFVGRATGLYKAQEGGLAQLESQYGGIAGRLGVDPKNVLVDFRVKNPPQENKLKGGIKKGTIKDGYVFMGGDPADPKSWKAN